MRYFQFFVVSMVFLVTWTTWQWLPHMSESKWAYFAMTSLFFINNSVSYLCNFTNFQVQVNPTVYLLFNTQLRRELHYLLCRHRAISGTHDRKKQNFFGATDPLITTKVGKVSMRLLVTNRSKNNAFCMLDG